MTTSEDQSREATNMMKGLLLGTMFAGLAFAWLVFTVIAVIFMIDRLAPKTPPPVFPGPHTVLEGENPCKRDSSQK